MKSQSLSEQPGSSPNNFCKICCKEMAENNICLPPHVKKIDGVRAKSVHKTLEEAQASLSQLKGYAIEVRPGERTRCEKYCQVNGFCSQYQKYLKEKNDSV